MDPETSSAIGAITGAVALLVSLVALFRTGMADRRATLVVRWVDSRLLIENLGPARARQVRITPQDKRTPGEEGPMSVSVIAPGYVHRRHLDRYLGESNQLRLEVSWKDQRWRRRREEVLVSEERTPPTRPPISDDAVAKLAFRVGEGVGLAVRDSMKDAARRRRMY